jgi:hypothetical protein
MGSTSSASLNLMQNWHILYNAATGRSVSIATPLCPIADPLPAHLTALPLTDAEGEGLQNGLLKWDEETRVLIPTPPPSMSAADWVDAQGFSGNRTTTMLYLKLQLDAAGRTSPKLAAVQGWLDALIVAGVTQPEERRSDWAASPYTFEEASGEALAILAAP